MRHGSTPKDFKMKLKELGLYIVNNHQSCSKTSNFRITVWRRVIRNYLKEESVPGLLSKYRSCFRRTPADNIDA